MEMEEKVVSFCQIAGADTETAEYYLAASDNNVEQAILLYMENNDNDKSHSKQEPIIISDSEGEVEEEEQERPSTSQPSIHPFRTFSEQKRKLDELFKAPTQITFHGSLSAARTEAQRLNRLLLISLHDPTEFACQVLNRDLWSSSAVVEFIQENLLFSQLLISNEEGMKFSSYYGVEGFPHISLLDPKTGERLAQWQTVMSPLEFIQEVSEKIERYSPKQEEEQKEQQKEQKKEMNLEAKDMVEPPLSENSTRIQLRLPDGSKLVRRFLKTCTILEIFQLVKYLNIASAPFDVFLNVT